MRVTVIATGLDGERVRRCRGDDFPTSERSNVTPLRREPLPLDDRLSVADHPGRPIASELGSVGAESPRASAAPSADWMSPFEDELDVPTFIRRRDLPGEDEDPRKPAFLRRSAD